jgi:hypothetical protein
MPRAADSSLTSHIVWAAATRPFLYETASADGRVIHGEEIEIQIQARQSGEDIVRRAQGETRAEDSSQKEGLGQEEVRQEDPGRGKEKEDVRHEQEETLCCEKSGCAQSSGGQEKEAIQTRCDAGRTRRENHREIR